MKKIQRILAGLLAFAVIFTTAGFHVAAEEGVVQEESQESNPQLSPTEDTQEIVVEDTQEIALEDTQETTEESILEYVYVDEATIHITETQYIAIGFHDEQVVLEAASLQYSSMSTGEAFEVLASSVVNNAVLFTIEYPEGSVGDQYVLDSLRYTIAGVEQTVEFAEEEIEAGYVVTTEPKEEQTEAVEEVPEVTVYTLDESGESVEVTGNTEEIEETVADALVDAHGESPAALHSRAGETIVVICAGHDSTHIGARGNGLKEEELTFKVAQYVKEALEKYDGVTVYLDRSSLACKYPGQTTGYCLNQRVKDAASLGATVFVDIHFNTGGGAGAEVYYPNKSYNESISQDGKKLAEQILKQLESLGLKNRGAKIRNGTTGETDSKGNVDDYYTTNYLAKQYGMTGIIVEHAFLDSSTDAEKLKNESFLKQLGEADAAGIAATYGFTKNNGTPKVSINNKNDFTGTAQIALSGIGSGANVAIWSDVNGQDDLRWYRVNGSSGNISFDVKNFKNSKGVYQVHVYNSTSTKLLTNTTFKISTNTTSSIAVNSVNGAEKQYKLQLKFADMPDVVKTVQFPVWSKSNQSDIRWIQAAQTSSGIWEATVNINDYKSAGTYQVHAYATLSNGTQQFLTNTTFKVSAITAKAVVSNYQASKGTFEVIVSGIQAPSGVAKVQVPVWSRTDQSDIKWYDAVAQGNGTYKVTVSSANHGKNTGIYTGHVYITGGNGVQTLVAAITQKIDTVKASVVVEDKRGDEKEYTLTLNNANTLGNVTKVQFATWSEENGQDDIIWYDGKKNSSGSWSATAQISKHKSAGVYQVHVYAIIGGKQKFVGNTTFVVSKQSGTVKVENYNQSKGTFDIVISKVSAKSGIEKVQVPVWSKSNQSDIVWYDAKKQSNGTYKISVKISNHKGNVGKYNIHVYVTGNNKVMTLVANTTLNVTTPKAVVSATNADGKEQVYSLKVENPSVLGSVTNVQFATWSEEKGQDDIVWYSGKKSLFGDWSAAVQISKHKTTGKYQVHVYANVNGRQQLIGNTTFTVSKPSGKLAIENYNQSKGTFDVVVRNVSAKAGVKSIQIPVWGANNQSDIRWYTASRQGDGSYRLTVKASNHKTNLGILNVHAYLVDGNGIQSFLGGTTQVLQAVEYYTIMGQTTTSVEQMVRYYQSSGFTYPSAALAKGGASTIQEFCKIYYEEAVAEGVRAEVAFAQAMKETGWLKFGGIVNIGQYNFAGLGALDGNSNGQAASFKDVRTGVRAQIQHLKAYGSNDALKNVCVDPRFHLVTRNTAPYVEWLGIKENPYGKGWATAQNYGYDIVDMIQIMKSK